MADNDLTRTPDREAADNPVPSTPAGPRAGPGSIRAIRAFQPQAYYLQHQGQNWNEDQVLTQIWTANQARPRPQVGSKRVRSGILENRLWLGGPNFDILQVTRILNIIGGVLFDGPARLDALGQELNPISLAFISPLVRVRTPIAHPDEALCMVIDPGLVEDVQYLSVDQCGYLKLILAYDSRHDSRTRGNVQEMGHRFVLWSIYGPPAPGMVCMHYCNNKRCLNPLHLVWGPQSENLQDGVSHLGAPAQQAAIRIVERMRQVNIRSGHGLPDDD